MTKYELKKVRKDIQELAKQLDLKYKKELYKVCFLTKQETAILNFLTGCPDPRFTKFGENINERLKNIYGFLESKEFKKLSNERGGCVVRIEKFKKPTQKLNDKKIKKTCKIILQKLKKSSTEKNIIVVTIPTTKKDKDFVLNIILFHEWIHILLISNRINFQNIKKKYWELDEGLTEYLQTAFKNKNADVSKIIKQRIKNNKSIFYNIYLKNALKFNGILKNKNNPKDRKKAILNYYHKLKKY